VFFALSILPLDIPIAPPAAAQDYPNQTVKIIVPFTAGGGVDVAARIIAPKLGEELGQSVIIEKSRRCGRHVRRNRRGAGAARRLHPAGRHRQHPRGTNFQRIFADQLRPGSRFSSRSFCSRRRRLLLIVPPFVCR